jgi:glycosyltransferase involved in cell wall biosynthesis
VRIAYVTSYDPNDRLNWSGLGYAIMDCLKMQGFDVVPIGPLADNFQQVGHVKQSIYRRLNRSYDFQRSAIVGYDYAWQVKRQLKKSTYDLVFSPGTIPISRLRCRQPIAIWADATWACYAPHYKVDPPWCDETIRAGHITERRAYERCGLLIFATQWAAYSAVRDYGVDPAKVRVVPFGANFATPIDRDTAVQSIAARATDHCKLISIGVDWHRKGMARSIELATALNAAGLRTELTVVGCNAPPATVLPSFVKLEVFIDKRKPDGERRLTALLMQSHFHVLLSTAEAFGVVFAEANAHAVPNITRDVGGLATAVVNGKGGHRFGREQAISDIVAYIKHHVADRDRYAVLACNARQEYDERLNWRASGAAVKKDLEELIASQ